MPNAYPNKIQVVRGGQTETLIDLTGDTITASALMQGYTAHDASGAPITGTATGGSMVIRDEADSHGGTIRHITAGTVVTGTTSITENGSYDVAQYADAVVNVPAPAPTLQSKTATPSESQQTIQPDPGYDGLSSVTVGAISSTYVGSGITRRSSTDLTASGATVTVPAGYYSAQASKAVASGTAGTPTATKGTVSNHSVSVTPSVTNATGYITGGTKTGTAVSVAASELVSGTLSITSSGTKDVTNYASASVAAGSATASAAKGAVSNHSVTVTPSVTRTAGYVTAGTSSGTAVTVSASELVSGTLSVTENGTADVTNYASVNVNVSSGGEDYETDFANTIMRSGAITSIPSGLTQIGDYAFYQCNSLAITSLPSSITVIGDYAFQYCSNLALTSLPSNVTTIGTYAFNRCVGITSISSDAPITSLGSYAFTGYSNYHMTLTSARFPNMAQTSNLGTVFGSTTAANACQLLETCDIGSTTGIASNSFANCYKLQTLVLRKSSVCTLANVSAFLNTPMRGYNGLTGTVYVPSALISSYQTATNWSTLYNDGTVTFAAIEGSDWEL